MLQGPPGQFQALVLLSNKQQFHFSPFFQELVIQQGGRAVSDGALDVRKHTKHMFSTLAGHTKFESCLRQHLKDKEVDAVKKSIK